MFLYSLLTAAANLLGRIPVIGRMVAGVLLLLLDVVAAFGDFSFLVALPGWIPILVGALLVLWLVRIYRRRRKSNAPTDVVE